MVLFCDKLALYYSSIVISMKFSQQLKTKFQFGRLLWDVVVGAVL